MACTAVHCSDAELQMLARPDAIVDRSSSVGHELRLSPVYSPAHKMSSDSDQ
jgi:hypothetical protein